MCIDPAKKYTAVVDTNFGSFTIELDPKAAPNTVNNFVVLSLYHYYDGITCHRVVADFVIQCGDPKGDGTGGPGYEFADELPAEGAYQLGSLAMANSGPNTNGSQFFVISGTQGTQLPAAVLAVRSGHRWPRHHDQHDRSARGARRGRPAVAAGADPEGHDHRVVIRD